MTVVLRYLWTAGIVSLWFLLPLVVVVDVARWPNSAFAHDWLSKAVWIAFLIGPPVVALNAGFDGALFLVFCESVLCFVYIFRVRPSLRIKDESHLKYASSLKR
jgi:hypothetical protein